MGARTGVGTPFPLRLLAQTSTLWRGVIFQGLPRSEIWEALYIIVYIYFRARNYSAGDPTAALRSGQNFTASDARWHDTARRQDGRRREKRDGLKSAARWHDTARRQDGRRREKRDGLKSALRVMKFVVFCERRSAPWVPEPESELLSLLDS